MAAAVKKANSAPRGSDRKKAEKQWVDVKRVYEYDNGWYIGYIDDPTDLATLGRLMGHCSGTHFVWACEERIWYFFALFDKDDVPHGTLHAKQTKWIGKDHPRDKKPPIPTQQQQDRCKDCFGRGYKYERDHYTDCPTCKATGVNPNAPKGAIGAVKASAGGYATFEDLKEAFAKAGLEYEPGKYRALYFNSRTYEEGRNGDRGPNGRENFEYQYGGDVFGGHKPPGISDETWAEYTKVFKALKDEYNKNNGFIKIAGRTFKFDRKDLVVLSFSDKSHQTSRSEYRKQIAEFLNAFQKVTKKEEAA